MVITLPKMYHAAKKLNSNLIAEENILDILWLYYHCFKLYCVQFVEVFGENNTIH